MIQAIFKRIGRGKKKTLKHILQERAFPVKYRLRGYFLPYSRQIMKGIKMPNEHSIFNELNL